MTFYSFIFRICNWILYLKIRSSRFVQNYGIFVSMGNYTHVSLCVCVCYFYLNTPLLANGSCYYKLSTSLFWRNHNDRPFYYYNVTVWLSHAFVVLRYVIITLPSLTFALSHSRVIPPFNVRLHRDALLVLLRECNGSIPHTIAFLHSDGKRTGALSNTHERLPHISINRIIFLLY